MKDSANVMEYTVQSLKTNHWNVNAHLIKWIMINIARMIKKIIL